MKTVRVIASEKLLIILYIYIYIYSVFPVYRARMNNPGLKMPASLLPLWSVVRLHSCVDVLVAFEFCLLI